MCLSLICCILCIVSALNTLVVFHQHLCLSVSIFYLFFEPIGSSLHGVSLICQFCQMPPSEDIVCRAAIRLKWCNVLTQVLLHQLALTALLPSVAYSIPKGRIGQVTLLVAAAVSRLPIASARFASQGAYRPGQCWNQLVDCFVDSRSCNRDILLLSVSGMRQGVRQYSRYAWPR